MSAQLAFDLAKILDANGTEAVLMVLRDACHAASHHTAEIGGGGKAKHWQEAADGIVIAMVAAAAAEQGDPLVDLGSVMSVLADLGES